MSLAHSSMYSSISKNLDAFLQEPERLEVVKTKVVCTIGPASWSEEGIRSLLDAGMSCMRLNFSHGNHEGHQSVIDRFRKVVSESGKICALMLDTKGPEIRTCGLKPNPQHDNTTEWFLEKGNKFTFVTDESFAGDSSSVAVTYPNMPQVLEKGSIIRVDDGLISLVVDEIAGDKIHCTIENSGWLSTHKGVNLPGAKVDLPGVTDRDKADIAFGVKNDVDFIAASFIRNAAHVEEIRALPGVREKNIQIISKIENAEGLQNFVEILNASDGIMVARGDLAVEIPLEKVPAAQKMMIRHCNRAGKPVITATQMMESMTQNPRPTRAEVNDVANAVFDGTDCVMLSGESAKGKYPALTVKTMQRICRQAERDVNYTVLYQELRADVRPPIPVSDSIASSAVKTQWDTDAKLIVGLTETGSTVRFLSKYRPQTPILCVTSHAQAARQSLLSRGVYPLQVESMKDEAKVDRALDWAAEKGFVRQGDLAVVASGVIQGIPGATNMIRVRAVGEQKREQKE